MNDRDPLREELANLPREVAPRRDLWPGIAVRLEAPRAGAIAPPGDPQPRRRRSTPPLWLAPAGLAAAALLFIVLNRAPLTHDDVASGHDAAIVALDRDYDLVRTDLLAALSVRCGNDASAGCAELRGGLDDLDRSAHELRQALGKLPADSATAGWLTSRFQRHLNLASALANLTSL